MARSNSLAFLPAARSRPLKAISPTSMDSPFPQMDASWSHPAGTAGRKFGVGLTRVKSRARNSLGSRPAIRSDSTDVSIGVRSADSVALSKSILLHTDGLVSPDGLTGLQWIAIFDSLNDRARA